MSKAPMPDSASGDRPMPSSFDEDLDFWDEGRLAKLGRRLKEEPLIPLGLGLTCYALYNAATSMRRGDKEATNRYFRARVYAQGFTIVCVCVGAIYWREDREKRKHYQGLLGEKRAREKREAWLRELEARDREEEVERQRRALRRETAAANRAARGAGDGAAEGSRADGADAGVENTSPLDEEREMRSLLAGSSILRSAMSSWWQRRRGSGD